MILPPMENRLPTGPGSRGGRWHEPEYRRLYYRAWRAAHPDYREREALRRARARAAERGEDTTLVVGTSRLAPWELLPLAAAPCVCPCHCDEPASETLRKWVAGAMDELGISALRLATIAHLDHKQVSWLVSGRRTLMFDTGARLVRALVSLGYRSTVCGFCRDGLHERRST